MPLRFDGPTTWPPEPNWHTANEADDASVVVQAGSAPPFGTLRAPGATTGTAGVYEGPYGLGRQEALGRPLRPFRRVLSGQALYRREVYL